MNKPRVKTILYTVTEAEPGARHTKVKRHVPFSSTLIIHAIGAVLSRHDIYVWKGPMNVVPPLPLDGEGPPEE
jgi:hypothetical protein